jgi:ribosomal protein S20
MRNSARKELRNQSTKSRLHHLERAYADLLHAGKKDDATTALKTLTSALDKASKAGVIHWRRADRHKSRLSLRLNASVKAKAA